MTKKYTLVSLVALIATLLMSGSVSAQYLPRPDHIIILIEENQTNATIIGQTSSVPYINALAQDSDAVVFSNFYALEHPSQPNYLDLFSGNNQGVLDDNVPGNYPWTTPNMAAELLNKSLTFVTYSQDLPSVGFDGANSTSGSYVRKHNPVTNWVGTGTNQVPATLNQPFSAFPTDFSQLPTVCYVVPDQDSDMHNGSAPTTCTIGDYWMHEHLDSLFHWIRDNNALFIYTFDEDDYFHGNNISLLLYGPMVKGQVGGATNNVHYTLYSLLRTIEDMYNLGEHAGAAASDSDIVNVWRQPAPNGINTVAAAKLRVSPNPANAVVNFDATALAEVPSAITITDVTGRVVAVSAMPVSKKLTLDVADYAPGMYFYHLGQGGSSDPAGKFIVTH